MKMQTRRFRTGRSISPSSGTIVLSGGGTVDYTTGLVTGGAGGTWGGEFDVPVRFDSGFPVEISNQRIESVTFALQELAHELGVG